jgi:DNA repair exonuclease SbcCD ATPase subunit
MTIGSFNTLDNIIKDRIFISCGRFQEETDAILSKLQEIQKVLLPLDKFCEYLKDIEVKVGGLRKTRPDCASLKQSYESVYEEYRNILDVVKANLNEGRGILEGYKRTLEAKKEEVTSYIKKLNEHTAIYSLWLAVEKEVLKTQLPEEISQFKTKLDEIIRRLEDCKNQISEQVSRINSLVDAIGLYQAELYRLEVATHDWEEIREKVAYPAAKPDEIREVEKAVRKRCRKCNIERVV